MRGQPQASPARSGAAGGPRRDAMPPGPGDARRQHVARPLPDPVAIRLCRVPDPAPPYDDEAPGGPGPGRADVLAAAIVAALGGGDRAGPAARARPPEGPRADAENAAERGPAIGGGGQFPAGGGIVDGYALLVLAGHLEMQVDSATGVSYEIDLWGRLRNATHAARADLLATEAARETVLITLTSDVAQAYFALRAFDGQLEATRRSLAARSEALGMQKKRFDVGDISEFDYRQLQADVAADRALLPVLELQRAQQENALAVLLGKSPRAIYEGALEAGSDPEDRTLAIVVPAGLPSDLLLRRPDLIQAEQTLIAANARVAVARAAYFPTLSLTGTLGSESVALSDLFTGPAGMWQAALAAGQPIYAGGRIDAQVQAAGARERQALAQYQLANAFRDVRDALVAQAKARERLEAESERVTALRTTLRFARLRYQNGMTGQLEVLDAERNLLAAEQNRIDALRSQRAAIADLFKALGGVWS